MKQDKLIIRKLNKHGYVLIKNFLTATSEFKDFKSFLLLFLNLSLNKNYKNFNQVDKYLSLQFKKNPKISAFLNDNINLSPFLHRLLVSKKIISLLSAVLSEKKELIILNNQRFRIQIPGNDKISNLPWHQDCHYNSIKQTKSIVVWISLGNINKKMGPIIFKDGSHKFGEQKKIKIQKENGGNAFLVNAYNFQLKNLQEIELETSFGDLILIDMNSVHTSGNNLTLDRVKYSAQARFHVVKK
jgi:ectoine hydroxylase-related dioxygenase (phytanoyl-CoA dioxygenase family)